jgi:hypothetical protein
LVCGQILARISLSQAANFRTGGYKILKVAEGGVMLILDFQEEEGGVTRKI